MAVAAITWAIGYSFNIRLFVVEKCEIAKSMTESQKRRWIKKGDKVAGLGRWGSKVMKKNKWYLSRSFVRRKIVVRASVCASLYSYISTSSISFSHPLLFIFTPSSYARFVSLVVKFVVTTASSTDTSLTLSERRRRRSSLPYATTKPILKITFEFRVCSLCDERERDEEEWGEK